MNNVFDTRVYVIYINRNVTGGGVLKAYSDIAANRPEFIIIPEHMNSPAFRST
jgi:hypothetical protein